MASSCLSQACYACCGQNEDSSGGGKRDESVNHEDVALEILESSVSKAGALKDDVEQQTSASSGSAIAEARGDIPMISFYTPVLQSAIHERAVLEISEENVGRGKFICAGNPEHVRSLTIASGDEDFIAEKLRCAERFQQLSHFAVFPAKISLHSGVEGTVIDFGGFFRSHYNAIEVVEVGGSAETYTPPVQRLRGKIADALRSLRRLKALYFTTHYVPSQLVSTLETLTELRFLSLHCYAFMTDVVLVAPKVEYCVLEEYEAPFRTSNCLIVDLSKMTQLVKVEFAPADPSRQLLLPLSDSKVRWITLDLISEVQGDLSNVVALKLSRCDCTGTIRLVAKCTPSLRELAISDQQDVVIDAMHSLLVIVCLKNVGEVRLSTSKTRPLAIVTLDQVKFASGQTTIDASNVWLSGCQTIRNLKLAGTRNLGAFCDLDMWEEEELQEVFKAIADELRTISIVPLPQLPVLSQIKQACYPACQGSSRPEFLVGAFDGDDLDTEEPKDVVWKFWFDHLDRFAEELMEFQQ